MQKPKIGTPFHVPDFYNFFKLPKSNGRHIAPITIIILNITEFYNKYKVFCFLYLQYLHFLSFSFHLLPHWLMPMVSEAKILAYIRGTTLTSFVTKCIHNMTVCALKEVLVSTNFTNKELKHQCIPSMRFHNKNESYRLRNLR